MSQDSVYYEKYLKYKSKYLELKKTMVGAGKHACNICTCTDFVGTSYASRCSNKNGCTHPRDKHKNYQL